MTDSWQCNPFVLRGSGCLLSSRRYAPRLQRVAAHREIWSLMKVRRVTPLVQLSHATFDDGGAVPIGWATSPCRPAEDFHVLVSAPCRAHHKKSRPVVR